MLGTKEERIQALNELFPSWEDHSIWTMFCRTCDRTPDSDFIIVDQRVYSYRAAREAANDMAKCLLALGVRRGNHVAVMLRNCEEYIFLTLALARLGAVKIPINPQIGRRELKHVLTQADAEFLFSCQVIDDDFFDELPKMRKALFYKRLPLNYRSKYGVFAHDFRCVGAEVPDSLLESNTAGPEISKELFNITFTSGSTSAPKGVMITHDMLLRTAYGSCLSRLFEPGRRICVPVPLYHNLGYVEGVMTALLIGGAIVISEQKITPDLLLHMIVDNRCNDLLTVPTQMMDFFAAVDTEHQDFSHVHSVYCSATTPPDWVWYRIREVFGVTDVIAAFGMTEVTASTLQTRPDDPADYVTRYVGTMKPGGVAGRPEFGGYQSAYKIIDLHTGEELPAGQNGEICCKGMTVMKGYYNQPEINRNLFDEDGWFHTNDIGRFEPNGYLIFLGRNNDAYKTMGELVLPQFVDSVIGKCDHVRAVSVVGVKDERRGEVGAAFLDPEDSSTDTLRKILIYCRQELASFQIPSYFIISAQETWPRTVSGKNPKYRQRALAEELVRDGRALKTADLLRDIPKAPKN